MLPPGPSPSAHTVPKGHLKNLWSFTPTPTFTLLVVYNINDVFWNWAVWNGRSITSFSIQQNVNECAAHKSIIYTSAEHLDRLIHPRAPVCHAGHLCSPVTNQKWLLGAWKQPPHNHIIRRDWQPPTGRRRVIYLPTFSWDKFNDPSQQNNTKREKPEKSTPGWTIWSSFGFF